MDFKEHMNETEVDFIKPEISMENPVLEDEKMQKNQTLIRKDEKTKTGWFQKYSKTKEESSQQPVKKTSGWFRKPSKDTQSPTPSKKQQVETVKRKTGWFRKQTTDSQPIRTSDDSRSSQKEAKAKDLNTMSSLFRSPTEKEKNKAEAPQKTAGKSWFGKPPELKKKKAEQTKPKPVLQAEQKKIPETQELPKSPEKPQVEVSLTTPDYLDYIEVKKKVARLELLMDTARLFSETLDVHKLMKTIFNKVLAVMEAEAGSFWVPDKSTGEIICTIAEGPAKKKVTGLRLKEGTGIVGWAMSNKENVVIFDASKDQRFLKQVDSKTSFVTKSMLCVTMVVKKECYGAIQVINKKTEKDTGQFNQIDLEILENIATHAAIAIKNAQLYRSDQRINELNTLLNFSKALTSTLDLDRVLISVVNLGAQVIHYSRAVIALLDANNQVVISAESKQAQPDQAAEENIQLKKIMDWVLSTGSSLQINSYTKESPPKNTPDTVLKYLDEFELKCLSVIILADSEGNLGLLSMEGQYASLVPSKSKYVIDMMVNQTTTAIRNAQLYQNIPSSKMAERFKAGVKVTKEMRRKIGMIAVSLVLGLFALLLLPVPSSVVSDVEVIPGHKTQVTVIKSGTVQKVLFKEGDRVIAGQVLLQLDTSLLELEKAKLENDILIVESDIRRLEVEATPSEIYMKQLELEKMENQLDVVDQKLQYTYVAATADGRVLTPKPEEMVNKQVTEGEVIAEIAVANKKSAKLLIKEEDVLNTKAGDKVSLTLQALPGIVARGDLIDISQVKIEDDEGREHYVGYLRSDELNQLSTLKFGMTGKAKIHTGNKTLYSVYLKPTVSRLITQIKLMLFS